MQQGREVEFEDDLSFAEYLQHYMTQPTEAELDDMGQELNTKSTLSFNPINNP